ncbi:MAG: hypothetical protein ACM3MK_08620 [Chitinophagales bacterium]
MGETVSVKFFNNEKEYIEATQLYYSQSKRTLFDTIIEIILIIIGIVCWLKFGFSWAWIICLIGGILGLTLRYIAYYVMPSIRFKQEPKFQDEYTLTFSDEGLEFMS